MAPGIAKLGHVELVTPSLEESVWFFRDVIGLQEVERVDETVYLRGQRDLEHHTLTLRAGERGAVDHIGWQTRAPEDVDAFATELESKGLDIDHLDAGDERGQGRAIRFRIPAGHVFELYYEIEKPDAPSERRSRLQNRVYSHADASASIPQRIDHVQIRGGDPKETNAILYDPLDFRLIEYIVDEEGDHQAGWFTTNSLAHTLAYLGGGDASFHHIAFHYDHLTDLWNAADVVREHGVKVEGGPGKHAITNANFAHVRDPGSGHLVELFTGTYHVFNPDWEPVRWTPDELENQPWLGSVGTAQTTGVE